MSSEDDDFEDLIGSVSVPVPGEIKFKKRPGPKPKAKPDAGSSKGALPEGDARSATQVLQALLNPVTITFLANVMGMKRDTVAQKLAPLKPVGTHRMGTPTYNFRHAMAYLAVQRVDAADIIKRIGSADLPPSLQKDVWDAKLKMQKWQKEAGELWPTEDVLETLGDAFKRLKTTTQLWVDQITDSQALPLAVREELTVLVDGLQMELHRALVEMPKERATKSQLGEIEGTDLDA